MKHKDKKERKIDWKKVNKMALLFLPIWIVGLLLREAGMKIMNWFDKHYDV